MAANTGGIFWPLFATSFVLLIFSLLLLPHWFILHLLVCTTLERPCLIPTARLRREVRQTAFTANAREYTSWPLSLILWLFHPEGGVLTGADTVVVCSYSTPLLPSHTCTRLQERQHGEKTLNFLFFFFFVLYAHKCSHSSCPGYVCEVWCGPPIGLFSIIIGLSWPFQIISIRQELGATDLLHLALSCFLLQHCAHTKYSQHERWIQGKVVAGGVTSATVVWHQRSICGKLMFSSQQFC